MKEKDTSWEINVIGEEDEINVKGKHKLGKLFKGFLVVLAFFAFVAIIAVICFHTYRDKEFERLLLEEKYDEAYEYYMENTDEQNDNIKALKEYLIDKEYEYATSKIDVSNSELEKFLDLILKFETEIRKKDNALYLDLNNFIKPEVTIKLGYDSYDVDLEGVRWYEDQCYYHTYYDGDYEDDYEIIPYKYKYERYDLSKGKVQKKDVDIVIIYYNDIELINSEDEAVVDCYYKFDKILKGMYVGYEGITDGIYSNKFESDYR